MLAHASGGTLAIVLVALAAAGVGNLLWNALPSAFSRFDRMACAWLGGLGLLSTLLFLIGQVVFTRWLVCLVVGTLAVATAVVWARNGIKSVIARLRAVRIPILPASIIAIVLAVTAVAGLSAPVGDWGNDAVVYHLLGPKVWLRNGVVRPVLDNCHTAFPATGEIIFAACMALGGQRAPGLFAVLTLIMFLLVVASLAVRSGLDARGAWWAAALVVTMPAVYIGGHSEFVDVLYASFVLAAVRVGFDAVSGWEQVTFGAFCGLAMATKYTGLAAVPALLLCLAVLQWRTSPGNNVVSMIKRAAIVLGVAAAISAPYYLRNWILLGSPIYPPPPILARVFHFKYMSLGAVEGYRSYILQRGAGLGRGLSAFLLLPFNLTYHTANFHGAGGIGLAPLALGPLGVGFARHRAFARTLAVLGLLLATIWFATDQESRFLIPVYVIGAIFAVLGWRHAALVAPRLFPLLAAAAVAISVLYGLFMIGSSRKDDLHAVFSKSYAQRREREQIPAFDSFNYLNQNPAVRTVMILDPSVPPYYSDKNYVKPFGQWGERPLPGAFDLKSVLSKLRDLHVSHVLDVASAYFPFQLPDHPPHMRLVFERDNQRVYSVEP